MIGWNIRNVRYEDIHAVRASDLEILVDSLDITDGDSFVDLMSGYGAITREVLSYARKNGIHVDATLVDGSKEQLERSYDELGNAPVKRVISDVREWVAAQHFDAAAIKMGVHELPKKDQQDLFDKVYSSLNSGGVLSVWDIAAQDTRQQVFFQDVIRKKDALAGFEEMVDQRYFNTSDELRSYFAQAGFAHELVHQMTYRLDTKKRLHTEFDGDEQKLVAWNDFIRSHIDEVLAQQTNFIDAGDTVYLSFPKEIHRGVK